MKSLIVMRASLTSAACVCAMLGLVTGVADATVQEALNEKRIASSSTATFRGEIDYSFDSSLNRTKALYRTSLESGNLIKRLFTSPRVHTLVVAYEVEGRTNPTVPDAVGLTLLSDEYYARPLDGRPTPRSPLLVIRIGETEFRYPVAIAEMSEAWSEPVRERYQLSDAESRYAHVHINPVPIQVHVQRRATAWIAICEFLLIVNGRVVRGAVASLAFDLSDEVLAGLRRFAAEMALLASGPSRPTCTKD